MLNKIFTGPSTLNRIAKEPPFRLLVKQLVRIWPFSIETKAAWDASPRPSYAIGVLQAANEAVREGISEVTVIEFGVAGGAGLVALQEIAAAVEKQTKVRILVYGFDTGRGLPETMGNFRDHPDRWKRGDYAMDQLSLKQRLTSRTTLILGDVAETIPAFVERTQCSPLGFVAIDLDLYSATRDALRIFTLPGKRMLLHVPMYFDDISQVHNNKFAGELLAIEEFNAISEGVKIDRWRGLADARAFPESGWLTRMYVAHDFAGVSQMSMVGRTVGEGRR